MSCLRQYANRESPRQSTESRRKFDIRDGAHEFINQPTKTGRLIQALEFLLRGRVENIILGMIARDGLQKKLSEINRPSNSSRRVRTSQLAKGRRIHSLEVQSRPLRKVWHRGEVKSLSVTSMASRAPQVTQALEQKGFM